MFIHELFGNATEPENDAFKIEMNESEPQNLKALAELLYLDSLY